MLDLRDCGRGGRACGRLLVLPHRAEPSCALPPSDLPVTEAGEAGDECFEKRVLTRKTGRTAESVYDNYADSAGKQRSRAHSTA